MNRFQLLRRRAPALAAALACLVIAPTAGAEDGVPIAGDPLDLAALTDAVLAGMPVLDPGLAALPAAALPVPVATVAAPPVPLPLEPISLEAQVPATSEPAHEPATSGPPDLAIDLTPEAVAAVETGVAAGPVPTSPPPQQHPVEPAASALGAGGAVADAPLASAEEAPVPEPQLAPAPPQYQPAQPQYQPPANAPALTTPPAPAAAPDAGAQNWDWTWSCGGSKPNVQPPVIQADVLPRNWNWNWDWNCGGGTTDTEKRPAEVGAQYHGVITQYHPVNVNISIRIASPGDNGAVTQTNVILASALQPLAAVGSAVDAAFGIAQLPPASAPEADVDTAPTENLEQQPDLEPAPIAAAVVPPSKRASREEAVAPKRKLSFTAEAADAPVLASPVAGPNVTPWATTPVVPRRLQPAATDGHRGRTQLRRPTRRPQPPLRTPVYTAGSFGTAPLGGSDGGFQLALLLVPFALALVDSVRRTVRDTAPPVGSAHQSRRERPG